MTRARRDVVSLEATPYYHCICRCVRRAFLWGEDPVTRQDYSHRKAWVMERLKELSGVFCIELCAYAVMSNHYHLVIRVNREAAEQLSDAQVVDRWAGLFSLPLLVERYQQELSTGAEAQAARAKIAQWRERLQDISWYMRCLNEPLARRANAEDGCRGRFWEGRFRSQALVDDAAVLTCMSYVDLNPIRAGMADTPEGSDYTSIQQRIAQWAADQAGTECDARTMPDSEPPLPPLIALKGPVDGHIAALGYEPADYLALVDWAGRAVRADKRGAIAEDLPPILARLHIDVDTYLGHVARTSDVEAPGVLGQVVVSNIFRTFDQRCSIG